MKRIVNLGKWMAVLSVGAFLFAGCMGPSSSDDAAIGPQASDLGAKFVYRMNVDIPNQSLSIDPVTTGTATGLTTTAYGGVIDVSTNGTCDSASAPSTCQVTITNLTPGQYVTNLRAWSYNSTSGTATIANSDFPAPDSAAGIEGSGLCIVEDGTYSTLATGNLVDKGCTDATQKYDYIIYTNIPVGILHPDCGAITIDWTFDTDSTNYNFYTALVDVDAGDTTLTATFHPEDATADGRMDMTNRTTFVVRPYDLSIDACPSCKVGGYNYYGCIGTSNSLNDGLKLGAPGCSNPIDWNSTTLPTGRYFAVAAGLEYPDRTENQNHANLMNASGPAACFDWLYTTFLAYTWDPAVLTRVNSVTTGANSNLGAGSARKLFQGLLSGNGENGDSSYINLDAGWRGAAIVNEGPNWLAVKRNHTTSHTFGPGALAFPSTCRSDIWNSGTTQWVAQTPTESSSFHGLATIFNDAGNGNRCTMQDQGVDADVDQWVSLQYFQVTGGSGSGSYLKIEQTVNYNYVSWYHSNCTTAGGFSGGDDLKGMCRPCTGSPCTDSGAGAFSCDLPNTDPGAILTTTGQELTNVNLPGGPNAVNGWGYQGSNAHICVQ